jgi:hypothetical protein
MKKRNILLSLRNKEVTEVTGYAHTLPTGHEAVVHKSLNRVDWTVSIYPLGLSIASGVTRKNAIFNADYRIKKFTKEDIDHMIKQYETYFRDMSVK